MPRQCPRLESNQHLLGFSQAPSPDRLQGHRCGRGGARPRTSSSIRLSESAFVARRRCSGTRIRTSTSRVKACRPAISRSPIGDVPGPGLEPGYLRSERGGLPLADPGSDLRVGPAGTRTPLARVRAECFAIKASGPHNRWLPSVGLEPTQAGLKGRYPTSWATTAQKYRQRVFVCGSGRTRTCAWAFAGTGLLPADIVQLAARMHAPPKRSRNSFSVPRSTSRNEKSRRGFPGRLSVELFASPRLTAPPGVGLETLGQMPICKRRHRAHESPAGVIAAEQATATGRNRGSLRFARYLADDQHDFAKVNSAFSSVKDFFLIS